MPNSIKANRLLNHSKASPIGFNQLYSSFVEPIYRYIYYRVNCHHEEAQDLTQQVFIQVWKHQRPIRQDHKLVRAWIYRIAHNIVIDHYRKIKNHVNLDTISVSSNENSEDIFLRLSDSKQLNSAIHRLPKKQQRLLYLKFIEGRSNKTLSAHFKTKETALRAMQHRALKRLKMLLTEVNRRPSP